MKENFYNQKVLVEVCKNGHTQKCIGLTREGSQLVKLFNNYVPKNDKALNIVGIHDYNYNIPVVVKFRGQKKQAFLAVSSGYVNIENQLFDIDEMIFVHCGKINRQDKQENVCNEDYFG
ncbi:MAG: hypothetical protein WCR30_03330 [Clostridia bacterium]